VWWTNSAIVGNKNEEPAGSFFFAAEAADGFTLYTMTDGARATLLDMRGTVVHRWELPFSRALTHAPHVEEPLPDEHIYWFNCYVYPNGDLLAIYQSDCDTPYGYGLVKLDKDSKLLWAYAGHAHHDLDVDVDGKIYTLSQKLVSKAPAGLEYLCAALLGASSALVFTLGLALPALLAGPTGVARLAGATLSISYSTAFIGPFIGGGLWDLFGLPELAFAPVAAASAVLVIGGLMLSARHA